MRHCIRFCMTIVLLSVSTMPAVLFAQPLPQLPPPPDFTTLERPPLESAEPIWLRGLRWLFNDRPWLILLLGAGAVGCSTGLAPRRPSRSARPGVLILGGLIVCTGMGLFIYGMRSEEITLLPLGAILVGVFGMIVVALGLPRRSQEGGY
jgi:hypothetical protein